MIGLSKHTLAHKNTINDHPIACNHRQVVAGVRFILRSKFLIKTFAEAAE
jgi:hypothetical protein